MNKIKKQINEDDCSCEGLQYDSGINDISSQDCNCSDCLEAIAQVCAQGACGNSKILDTNQKKPVVRPSSGIGGGKNIRPNHQHQNKSHYIQKKHEETYNNGLKQSKSRQESTKKIASRKKVSYEHIKCQRFQRQHFKLQFQIPTSPSLPEMPNIRPQIIDVEPAPKNYNQAQMQIFVNKRIQYNLTKHKHKKSTLKVLVNVCRLEELQKQQEIARRLQEVERNAKEEIAKGIGKRKHTQPKPWNYTKQPKQVQMQKHCHKVPIKSKTDCGQSNGAIDLEKLQKHQFLKQIKGRTKHQTSSKLRNILEKSLSREKIDKCQYHQHLTDNTKLQEIEKKIKQNAHKVLQEKVKSAEQAHDKQRLKQARLRGLGLQARKIVQHSKKKSVEGRQPFTYDARDYKISQQPNRNAQNTNNANSAEEQSKNDIKSGQNTKGMKELVQKLKDKKKKSKKSSKGNNRRQSQDQQIQIQGREEPNGRFFVWDIPIRRNEMQQVLQNPKSKPKSGSKEKFRKEVEQHIQSNMRKHMEKKIAKTKQQQFQQKVEKKKQELMKEFYDGKSGQPPTGPGLTDIPHLQKALGSSRSKMTH